MLALHLLQSALVHINTLLLQRVLGDPAWAGRLTDTDRRGLTPLFCPTSIPTAGSPSTWIPTSTSTASQPRPGRRSPTAAGGWSSNLQVGDIQLPSRGSSRSPSRARSRAIAALELGMSSYIRSSRPSTWAALRAGWLRPDAMASSQACLAASRSACSSRV